MAWGLHERGYHVRMLEERRNPILRRTLEAVGSTVSRHVYETFPGVLIHSFEPRSGAQLMEWVARELSLVDLAIAVDGLPVELARWIANLDHPMLTRVFVTFRPEQLTTERIAELELDRYDRIFATAGPAAEIAWEHLKVAIAPQDLAFVGSEYLPDIPADLETTTENIARVLESALLLDISTEN